MVSFDRESFSNDQWNIQARQIARIFRWVLSQVIVNLENAGDPLSLVVIHSIAQYPYLPFRVFVRDEMLRRGSAADNRNLAGVSGLEDGNGHLKKGEVSLPRPHHSSV